MREKIVFMNLDEAFPNMSLTAVIHSDKTNVFPDLNTYKDKTVEITGQVTEFRNRPQIVLNSTNDIKVVSSEKRDKAEKKGKEDGK